MTVSTEFINCPLKGHMCTSYIFSSTEYTLVVLHFLLLKPSVLNICNKLDACPLYPVFSCNFFRSALTVGSLFSYRCNLCIVLCTTHTHTHTHRSCRSLHTVIVDFIFFWCCMRWLLRPANLAYPSLSVLLHF